MLFQSWVFFNFLETGQSGADNLGMLGDAEHPQYRLCQCIFTTFEESEHPQKLVIFGQKYHVFDTFKFVVNTCKVNRFLDFQTMLPPLKDCQTMVQG